MKKRIWILPFLLAALPLGCGDDGPEGKNIEFYVSGDDMAVEGGNGVANIFFAGFSQALSSEAVVGIFSGDPERLSVNFEGGNDIWTYVSGRPGMAKVFATCADTGALEPAQVEVKFSVLSGEDTFYPTQIVRTVVCPGQGERPDIGVTVTPTSGLQTSEKGESATFQVVLDTAPSSDVVIMAKSSDETEGIVAPESVTFTPRNWQEPQTFTVTGLDDELNDGNVTYSILLGPAQSADSRYNGFEIPPVSAVNLDDDGAATPGVTVTPTSGLQTSEKGETAAFQVVLDTAPSSDVVITAKSFDETEGIVVPAYVTFTPQNWFEPQTFTVTGVDDDLADGDIKYSILLGPAQSLDADYNGRVIPSLSVVNLDDDLYAQTAEMALSAAHLTVYEGGRASFTVVPTVAPSGTVTVALDSTDETEGVPDKGKLTFTPSNWNVPQTVTVAAPRDGVADGDQDYRIAFRLTSTDARFNGMSIKPLEMTTVDTEGGSGEKVRIRAMAANTSTGNNQNYDGGHGIRIFQAVKPDIVMIQEFRYRANTDAAIRQMVDEAFGPDYFYVRGRFVSKSDIPNGIISKYPIIDSGYWKSNKISNRDWDWALVDLPGKKELLVVSVHLSTSDNASEIGPLTNKIKQKMTQDSANGLEYFVMLGGDFNSAATGNGNNELRQVLYTKITAPIDQKGDSATNETRRKILDWLFVDKAFHKLEVPVTIGRHSYDNGHVFDSRVYSSLGELGDVLPVRKNDSDGSVQAQHMAVIREFEYVAP